MQQLTLRQRLLVASMLFGMFFGAGNLIFPASMGQLAGRSIWQASAGFLITGVGLPLLGVAALGISRQNGLLELSSRVGKGYGLGVIEQGALVVLILPRAIDRDHIAAIEIDRQGRPHRHGNEAHQVVVVEVREELALDHCALGAHPQDDMDIVFARALTDCV